MSTPARERLNRERLVAGAVTFADDHGLADLSMRRLARDLGFEVMSLYNHVSGKRDLVEAMLEKVATEVDLPDESVPWRPAIETLAKSTHRALLDHPWAAEVWNQLFPGPTRLSLMEHLLTQLQRGGFDGRLADLAFHAVNMHVHGFAQQALSYRTKDETVRAQQERFAREISADLFPQLLRHVAYHQVGGGDGIADVDEFDFVLSLILDGLERSRDAPAGSVRSLR